MDSNHSISADDYKKQIRDLKRHNVLSCLVTICFTVLLHAFLLYLFTGTLSFSGTGYILLLFSLLCGSIMVSILCAKSLAPMVTSLSTDCDPRKFIALNRAIKRRFYPLPVAYALGYFFLGDFEFSAMYAEQAARAKGLTFSPHRFSMHCFKAYSEYMQGLYATADHTIRNFEDLLSRSKPQEQKKYEKSLSLLRLMQAMMDSNIEKINEYRAIEFRSEFKPLEGWMHYLLGTAAFQVADYETAFQHFSVLMQGYEKTFLASAAAEYIEKINPLLPDSGT